MQQVGSHQQDIVPAKARSSCWARGHWRCHTTSRATESAGPRLAFPLCSPGMCYGCVGGYSQCAPVVERCRAFLAEERLRVAERCGLGLLQGGLQGVEERHRAGLQSTREGVREKFPPHPPSVAGVLYPDVSAGADHPVVALSPGTGGQGHAGGYLDAHPEVKQLFGPPEIFGVSIPSQTCRNCKSLQVY